jgi:L-threonylcarbamoyladenylate synthase
MKTVITTSFQIAADYLRKGKLVAFPTETVYGLGADVFQESAVKKIFLAKGRPSDNPLIVHITSKDDLAQIVNNIPPVAEKLIDVFFPGPFTIILPKHKRISGSVTSGLSTVAVRMPRHPLAQKFLRACGTPVAAPSANRSGRPSPTTWHAVRDDMEGRISCILKGERANVGLESTVVDCTSKIPVILRTGAISLEKIRRICPETRLASPSEQQLSKSPGMKYRHYAPNATVRIIDSPGYLRPAKLSAYIGLDKPDDRFHFVKICPSLTQYARALFDFFRIADRKNITIIYCQRVPKKGLGTAIMDRLERAACH